MLHDDVWYTISMLRPLTEISWLLNQSFLLPNLNCAYFWLQIDDLRCLQWTDKENMKKKNIKNQILCRWIRDSSLNKGIITLKQSYHPGSYHFTLVPFINIFFMLMKRMLNALDLVNFITLINIVKKSVHSSVHCRFFK